METTPHPSDASDPDDAVHPALHDAIAALSDSDTSDPVVRKKLREDVKRAYAAWHGPGYWHALIDEKEAGEFLKLSIRTMQSKRVYGGGPRFIRLSSRCIRYRRIDLREWADGHSLRSTSDPGSGA